MTVIGRTEPGRGFFAVLDLSDRRMEARGLLAELERFRRANSGAVPREILLRDNDLDELDLTRLAKFDGGLASESVRLRGVPS